HEHRLPVPMRLTVQTLHAAFTEQRLLYTLWRRITPSETRMVVKQFSRPASGETNRLLTQNARFEHIGPERFIPAHHQIITLLQHLPRLIEPLMFRHISIHSHTPLIFVLPLSPHRYR